MSSETEDPTVAVSPQDDGALASAPPPRPAATPSSAGGAVRAIVTVLLILLFLGAGAGAFLGFASLRKGPGRAATPPPRTTVRVRPATRSVHQEVLHGYGRARALRRTTVSAELGATVVALDPAVEAGSAVTTGTVLVTLDDRTARAARDAAAARLASAEADVHRLDREGQTLDRQLAIVRDELGSAERELEREQKMLAEGTSSASAVDNRSMQASVRRAQVVNLEGRISALVAQKEAAEAAVRAARAEVARSTDDLDRCQVRAPFAGIVETRHASLGERVAPGTPLFDLVDPAVVEIPVALPASRYADVQPGAAVELRLAEDGEPVAAATVARVAPAVDPASRTFAAYVLVRATDGAARAPIPPGAFVVARIDGRRYEDVVVVPRAAFVSGAVFVATPTEGLEATVREVHPGVRARLVDVVLVDAGLDAGDRIVVTNVEQIADGSRVQLVREQDGAE